MCVMWLWGGGGNTNNHLAFESILPTVSMVSERGIAKPNWFMESNLDCALIMVTSRLMSRIIMNFVKAFDKVQHRRQLYNLDYYGINPFLTNGISHPYHLDELIFIFGGIGSIFFFHLNFIFR